jgi:hypothetical protein
VLNMQDSQQLKDQYQERLKKIISKKFDTTMIFSLSQFEAAYGHLWGHGLPEEKLNDDQLTMRNKWKECRNNILNNGNQQKRNANAEISMHEVVWKRYQTVLLPMDQYEDLNKQENKE